MLPRSLDFMQLKLLQKMTLVRGDRGSELGSIIPPRMRAKGDGTSVKNLTQKIGEAGDR